MSSLETTVIVDGKPGVNKKKSNIMHLLISGEQRNTISNTFTIMLWR